MQTKVVNIKTYKGEYTYIGRGSPFGNPFRIGKDGDRDEVINKHRDYFFERIESDFLFRDKVMELQGKTLGCYCAPLACHGDTIKAFLDKIRRENNENTMAV